MCRHSMFSAGASQMLDGSEVWDSRTTSALITGCMFTFMFYCMLGKESIVKFLSLFYLIFASVLAHFFSITTYHTYQNKRDNMPNRTSDLEQDASASDAETDPTARVTQSSIQPRHIATGRGMPGMPGIARSATDFR